MTRVVVNGNAYSDDGSAVRDMRQGGHREWLLLMLGDVIAEINSTSAVAKAGEAAISASVALQAKALAEAVAASITVGSTASLAYPEVVKNLATASDVVDVFVYDTRLDSDGGAWTDRCHGASWFSETLNTPTRGAKRAFPKKGIIVLRSGTTNPLALYDALDLDPATGAPRLWRIFPRSSGGILDGTPAACFAMNGRVWVATSAGLYTLDFPADRASRRDATDRRHWNAGIANASVYGGAATSGAIVSASCNHVHARVLPGGPLDPVGGLPIPTVAVATPAGVSVIHPTGAVANVTHATGYSQAEIVSDAQLMLCEAAARNIDVGPMPYAATVARGSWRTHGVTPSSAPALLASSTGTRYRLCGNRAAFSTAEGLTFLAPDDANNLNGMVAYTTKDYATGWQPGAALMAALCEGAVGVVVASGNLITNGSFTSDVSGWNGPGVWSADGAVITAPGGAADNRFFQTITCEVGAAYTIDVTTEAGGNSRNLFVAAGLNNTSPGSALASFTTSGVLMRVDFIATSTNMTVVLRTDSTTAGQTFTVKSVSAKKSAADRSYRGGGLVIEGALTRAAVSAGADLAAWSGWSNSNYLRQPYNPDLDFGTGDFSIALWTTNPNANSRSLLSRSSATGLLGISTVSGQWRLFTGDGGGSTILSGTTTPPATGYNHIIGIRRAGVLELWVNGTLEASAASTRNLTDTSAVLTIGNNFGLTSAWEGALALLRISAYAPTPAQIARMYADERPLFDVGAKAFLGGTSSAVADATYSEASGWLAAATADGVSIFAGLRRAEYLDGASIPLAIANDTMRAVGMEGGVVAFGSSANAGMRRDAIIGLDRMPATPVRAGTLRRMRAAGVTPDASPLSLVPRIHIGERETVLVEATIVGRVNGASDSERLSYVRRGVYYRQAGGNVTLQGSVQTIGTDTETTSGADATLAIDTAAQTVTPQVTGVAATRIVWAADIRITRASEGSLYEEAA
ncbi:LamG domain-containing protein [Roseomonas frigidaquae]|uniref:LamG domain-containing protein n=1 Tax=Falsiroseomonas frigidaquae TaxID=487318 RepID=A0ABX1ETY1_9PROT|nr:LamG domain-containing protein [Falsiroseomonas frigidaquae]NKE43374.1 LamG domain-containing protein [Falsiroseomonas frigidaquae]